MVQEIEDALGTFAEIMPKVPIVLTHPVASCETVRSAAVEQMKNSDNAKFINATIGNSDIAVIVLLFCFCLGMAQCEKTLKIVNFFEIFRDFFGVWLLEMGFLKDKFFQIVHGILGTVSRKTR